MACRRRQTDIGWSRICRGGTEALQRRFSVVFDLVASASRHPGSPAVRQSRIIRFAGLIQDELLRGKTISPGLPGQQGVRRLGGYMRGRWHLPRLDVGRGQDPGVHSTVDHQLPMLISSGAPGRWPGRRGSAAEQAGRGSRPVTRPRTPDGRSEHHDAVLRTQSGKGVLVRRRTSGCCSSTRQGPEFLRLKMSDAEGRHVSSASRTHGSALLTEQRDVTDEVLLRGAAL